MLPTADTGAAMMNQTERYRRAVVRRNDISRLEHLYRFANFAYQRYWSTKLEPLAVEHKGETGVAGRCGYLAMDGGWEMGSTNEPDNDLGLLVRKRFRVLSDHGTRVGVVRETLDRALHSLVSKQVEQWVPHSVRLVCVTVNGRPYWYQGHSHGIPSVSKVAWSDEEPLMMEVDSG